MYPCGARVLILLAVVNVSCIHECVDGVSFCLEYEVMKTGKGLLTFSK